MSRYLLDLSWQKDAMKAQLQMIIRAVSRHRLAQRYHLQRAAETRSSRAHSVAKQSRAAADLCLLLVA